MIYVAHLQVHDANFRGRLHTVTSLGSETHDPWTRIVDVDFSVTRVYGGEGNPVPSAKFYQVFDGRDSNLNQTD